MTVAVVKIGGLSTIYGFATIIGSILFLPVWLVGIVIALIPGLSATPKNAQKRPPYAGIIVDPKSTFMLVIERQPLRSTLLLYFALQAFFLLLSVILLNEIFLEILDSELLSVPYGVHYFTNHI